MANQRQMHLAVFWLGTGNHSAGWRMPNANFSNSEWSFVETGAQMAERGKFDLFFVGVHHAARFTPIIHHAI